MLSPHKKLECDFLPGPGPRPGTGLGPDRSQDQEQDRDHDRDWGQSLELEQGPGQGTSKLARKACQAVDREAGGVLIGLSLHSGAGSPPRKKLTFKVNWL